MEKDVASVVLSSLSLLVSVVTASLGYFYWRHQETSKTQQRVVDVKEKYRSDGVPLSVQEVADVVQHNAAAPHQLWDLLFQRQAAINTNGGTLSRRELLQHMSKADTYWDHVVDLHSQGKLPGYFHTNGGWLKKANNYRCLLEPLFIANYCQFETTPYLDAAADKRPKRYWYIQELWAELQPSDPQRDSTAWAVAYAQQVGQQAPNINMQGIPPVQ